MTPRKFDFINKEKKGMSALGMTTNILNNKSTSTLNNINSTTEVGQSMINNNA